MGDPDMSLFGLRKTFLPALKQKLFVIVVTRKRNSLYFTLFKRDYKLLS